VWDVLSQKYDLNENGFCESRSEDSTLKHYFKERSAASWEPRTLFMDMEFDAVNGVRSSNLKNFFNDDVNYAFGYTSASSNFARGYFSDDAENLARQGIDKWRVLHEECDMVDSIHLINGLEGGTGSGFASIFVENLTDLNYMDNNETMFAHQLYSSKHLSSSTNSPFNVVLGYYGMSIAIGVNFIYDNECLFARAHNVYNLNPTFAILNDMLAPIIAQATVTLDPSSIVPFPQLNHIMAAHCPYTTDHKSTILKPDANMLVHNIMNHTSDLTSYAFSPYKAYIAACFIFEENRPKTFVEDMKLSIPALVKFRSAFASKFVPWSPGGVKSHQSLAMQFPRNSTFKTDDVSLTGFFNTTAAKQMLHHVMNQFDQLYGFESFTHWYTKEKMDKELFKDAREHLEHVHEAYQVVFMDG